MQWQNLPTNAVVEPLLHKGVAPCGNPTCGHTAWATTFIYPDRALMVMSCDKCKHFELKDVTTILHLPDKSAE